MRVVKHLRSSIIYITRDALRSRMMHDTYVYALSNTPKIFRQLGNKLERKHRLRRISEPISFKKQQKNKEGEGTRTLTLRKMVASEESLVDIVSL